MVEFIPLADHSRGVRQGLLKCSNSETHVILDLGWDYALTTSLDQLSEALVRADLILLSHASIANLGAYAYLCKSLPFMIDIPVYATLPVVNMGRVLTLNAYRSKGIVEPIQGAKITAAEVESYFDRIRTVKYSQPVSLTNSPNRRLHSIKITAFNAGHSLGGAIWKISDDLESYIYAVDWNHAKDMHLPGAFLDSRGQLNEQLSKPALFITSTDVAGDKSAKSNRQELCDNIDNALSNNGTATVVCSSTARMLEVILIVAGHVKAKNINVPLIVADRFGKRTLSYASMMLEWMVSTIIDAWQIENVSPFDAANLRYVGNIEGLEQFGNAPKVVFTSDEALELGLSRQVFVSCSKETRNVVVFAEHCPKRSLADAIHQLWIKKTNGPGNLVSLSLTLPSVDITEEIPLSDEELKAYKDKLNAEIREHELKTALEKRNIELLAKDVDDEESSSEDELGEVDLQKANDPNVLFLNNSIHDVDCLALPEARIKMFPFLQTRAHADGYGEPLKNTAASTLIRGSGADREGNVSTNGNVKEEAAEIQSNQTIEGKSRLGSIDASRDWLGDGITSSSKLDAAAEPRKLRNSICDVRVLSKFNFLDLNGRTNVRSLSMIVSQLKASAVIALPGNDIVINQLQKLPMDVQVGDQSRVFAATSEFRDIELSSDLAAALRWHPAGNYMVARVVGELNCKSDEQASHDTDDLHDDLPEKPYKSRRLELITPKHSDSCRATKQLLVGDLKLNALRQRLSMHGISSEFQSTGVLSCGDKVMVRKINDSTLSIEGGVDSDAHRVKTMIKSFLASL